MTPRSKETSFSCRSEEKRTSERCASSHPLLSHARSLPPLFCAFAVSSSGSSRRTHASDRQCPRHQSRSARSGDPRGRRRRQRDMHARGRSRMGSPRRFLCLALCRTAICLSSDRVRVCTSMHRDHWFAMAAQTPLRDTSDTPDRARLHRLAPSSTLACGYSVCPFFFLFCFDFQLGDLGNIIVKHDGMSFFNFRVANLPLIDVAGRALAVMSGEDDLGRSECQCSPGHTQRTRRDANRRDRAADD